MSGSNKRYLMLQSLWAILFGIALVSTFAGMQYGGVSPLDDEYYGDACQDTCPENCRGVEYGTWFFQDCCLWDWGCQFWWPFTGYQMWHVDRRNVTCFLPPPPGEEMGQSVLCCTRWHTALIENGPCCYRRFWDCPARR
jgi:hypothetical protein